MEIQHCSSSSSSTHPCSILPRPCPWRTLPPPPTPSSSSKPISHYRISCSTNYRRWDSNAETVRSSKFNFNSKDDHEGEDDDDDDDVDDYGKKWRWWSESQESQGQGIEEEGTSGVWEDAIDSTWIFKAFKSYGWTFPIFLLSCLLVSGPKAFLMALALPLGQSALTLAFEKLWGTAGSKPKRKSRVRKPRTVSGTKVEKGPEETQKTRRGKAGYQSWVVENNGSVEKGSQKAPSFGGWDDLDRSGPATRSSRVTDGSQRMPVDEGKLSKRGTKGDTPLLLRLLIAIFPFLGTWTKML